MTSLRILSLTSSDRDTRWLDHTAWPQHSHLWGQWLSQQCLRPRVSTARCVVLLTILADHWFRVRATLSEALAIPCHAIDVLACASHALLHAYVTQLALSAMRRCHD
jgi:hypothetical protein